MLRAVMVFWAVGFPQPGQIAEELAVSTSLSADWSKLGLDWDPVSGDLQILQRIVDDFRFLRDTAWLVSQGLDAFVASASSGGFEGATAAGWLCTPERARGCI